MNSFWKFVSKWSFRASMSMVAVYIFSMVWGSDNLAIVLFFAMIILAAVAMFAEGKVKK